ncbi:MAG: putative monovalent cation/H+ antiporter subunit A [Anaerolineales bacterium]|nr:putative monovalent cation/H+ antiporter subunit A [Anaerolineales bacterium]
MRKWLIALLPLALTFYFASFIPAIAGGETSTATIEWIPSLDIQLSFYIDGLSLLMALIISGIGTLIIIYGGEYLAKDERLPHFYILTLLFMSAMLGVVLARNLIALFIFWELTSITSFLLIGFKHEYEKARKAALQALLVTGSGGLALLAGLVLLGLVGGSFDIPTLFQEAKSIQKDSLYLPILVLVLAGAFTKSAQMPFHFWLPGAMEAPTPVSAYLHSATMVKAGVYLLARFTPILGGTPEWHTLVIGFGSATMLLAAYIALQQTDLKRILAFSTVSALGTLVFLLGVGTPLAIKGAVIFLVSHSLYKGGLFLVAGSIDHETGTRDVNLLGNLRQSMPFTFVGAILATGSMAGIPPLVGFIAKEVVYEATLEESAALLLTGVAVLTNMLTVAAAVLLVIRPFINKAGELPKSPHETPLSMWLGPILLGILGLAAGVFAPAFGANFVEAAINGITQKPKTLHLALWHGWNTMLMLSMITVAGGVIIYIVLENLLPLMHRLRFNDVLSPATAYQKMLDGLLKVADAQTRLLQHGYLRRYVLVIVISTASLVGYTLVTLTDLASIQFEASTSVRVYEGLLFFLIMVAIGVGIRAKSRIAAVATLGVVGNGVALIFLFYGAPDLAMTQFAVETLTVLLFVLAVYRLPLIKEYSGKRVRIRDGLVAASFGIIMTALILMVISSALPSNLTNFFAEYSLPKGKGRNIVNVILVDFRGFDTLAEITVLAVAALGVYALLKWPTNDEKHANPTATQELDQL